MKCGIDIVDVKRFENLSQHFKERIFTAEEIEYCEGKVNPSESFAGIFAAKEAFFKAIGTGILNGIAFHEISVCHNTNGRPFFKLSQHVGINADKVDLSISHTADKAVAMCVISER